MLMLGWHWTTGVRHLPSLWKGGVAMKKAVKKGGTMKQKGVSAKHVTTEPWRCPVCGSRDTRIHYYHACAGAPLQIWVNRSAKVARTCSRCGETMVPVVGECVTCEEKESFGGDAPLRDSVRLLKYEGGNLKLRKGGGSFH
jgi:hypothetical protein